jgi:hypothetical protein
MNPGKPYLGESYLGEPHPSAAYLSIQAEQSAPGQSARPSAPKRTEDGILGAISLISILPTSSSTSPTVWPILFPAPCWNKCRQK